MEVTNKDLQRKTIKLDSIEVRDAIICFIQETSHSFEETMNDGTKEYVGIKEGDDGKMILLGKNTSVEFDDKGGATVTTFYG